MEWLWTTLCVVVDPRWRSRVKQTWLGYWSWEDVKPIWHYLNTRPVKAAFRYRLLSLCYDLDQGNCSTQPNSTLNSVGERVVHHSTTISPESAGHWSMYGSYFALVSANPKWPCEQIVGISTAIPFFSRDFSLFSCLTLALSCLFLPLRSTRFS
jgi:hypothetical protein